MDGTIKEELLWGPLFCA